MNYYNDNDKNSCAWLKELIKAGLIPCADGKARRTGTRSTKMADGVSRGTSDNRNAGAVETIEILCESFPCRASILKGYGNAIVPQVASEFIKAFMEA